MLIDSHAHLSYFPESERHEVISRAFREGISLINNISTEVSKIEDVLSSSMNFKNIYCSVGTHPCHVQDEPNITSTALVNLVKKHKKIIGIGETGLDYFHSKEHRDLQIQQLHTHILAAATLQIPVIIHTRDADDDTLKILTDSKENYGDALKILIHCFTGGMDFCQKLLAIGSYISFSGIITFKNAKELQNTMKVIPMEKILIETDSPYLAPVPYRGKTNEPSFVKYVAQFIAQERNLTFEEVSKQTSQNFCQLFGFTFNEDTHEFSRYNQKL